MKKKSWFSLEKIRGIPKNQLLVGGLAGLLLLVVAIPTEQGRKQAPKQETGVAEEVANGQADSSVGS